MAASVGTPAMSTSDGLASLPTWSMQNSAMTGSVVTPATASSITVSADEDSDDYDLNVVIRKESAKNARSKELDHGAFRPDPDTLPPAFRTATLVNVNTFPNFLTSQTSNDSSKNGTKNKVNDIGQEVHQDSKINKGDDEGEKSKRRKKYRINYSNRDNNNNRENGPGASREKAIVIDDSGDEGGETTARAAKKIKTGKPLSLTRENLGALEASNHKSLVANTKVSGKKTHKGSKPHKKSRHQDVRHHSSLLRMNGLARL